MTYMNFDDFLNNESKKVKYIPKKKEEKKQTPVEEVGQKMKEIFSKSSYMDLRKK